MSFYTLESDPVMHLHIPNEVSSSMISKVATKHTRTCTLPKLLSPYTDGRDHIT